ncbi:hypothetical protein KCP69_24865 [Salmonella enterica subsp. enterica]|nr:hypothetical protein KCP69_24865 [Salmonella enterica subsp. enterica]
MKSQISTTLETGRKAHVRSGNRPNRSSAETAKRFPSSALTNYRYQSNVCFRRVLRVAANQRVSFSGSLRVSAIQESACAYGDHRKPKPRRWKPRGKQITWHYYLGDAQCVNTSASNAQNRHGIAQPPHQPGDLRCQSAVPDAKCRSRRVPRTPLPQIDPVTPRHRNHADGAVPVQRTTTAMPEKMMRIWLNTANLYRAPSAKRVRPPGISPPD